VALAEPQRYLSGDADLGAGAAQEDACIAYKLFLTVHDWRQIIKPQSRDMLDPLTRLMTCSPACMEVRVSLRSLRLNLDPVGAQPSCQLFFDTQGTGTRRMSQAVSSSATR